MSVHPFSPDHPKGSPSASQAPVGSFTTVTNNFSLTLRPGRYFRLACLGPPVALLALLVGVYGALAVRNAFANTGTQVFYFGFTGIGLAAMLANVLYWRSVRLPEIDSRGVRWKRSGRLVREIPWPDVARVRYGMVTMSRGSRTIQVPHLWVHATRSRRGIYVLESGYTVPPGSLLTATQVAIQMANERGIPVIHKDGLIRDFGPPGSRL